MATKPTLPPQTADAVRAAAAEEKGKKPSKTTKKPAGKAAAPTTTVATSTGNGDVAFGDLEAVAAGSTGGSTKISNKEAVINMTGITGVGGKNGRLKAGDWSTSLDRLAASGNLSSLQSQLWEAGFYPADFYYQNGPRPVLGERIDAGLESAYVKFINLSIDNPTFAANDILQSRRKQYASTVGNIGGGGGQNALNVQVEPTQVLRLPGGDALGAVADAAAQKVLGRNLAPGEERDKYVAMARKMLMDSGMTEADVDAYNRGLQRQAVGQEAAFGNAQAAGQTATASTGKTGGSRSWRNNNPGNLRYGDFAKSHGATGQDSGGFAIFPSEEAGSKAQEALLFGGKYKDLSIAAALEKYAPRADNNPHNASRIATVSKATGVSSGTKLSSLNPAQRKAFLDSVTKTEGYTVGKTTGTPTASGAGSVGGQTTVTTLTGNYPGSMPTPSGGNVVITPSNENLQATLEAQIKKDNPTESGAVSFGGAFDVFERLMRGGR